MKKFTALLLVLAMLLPACSAATDGSEGTDDSAESTSLSTVLTTTAEPTVPTDTLPSTVSGTEAPETTPVTSEPATDAPSTTTAPVTTLAPETTEAPVTTTDVPATTTDVPEMTKAPETTTKKPETTKAPETTTKKPETTKASETTTKKPETTKAPVITTKKPETTKAPVTTTKKPETTKAPVTTTKTPVTTTKKPVTTKAPVTTKVPVTTTAPHTHSFGGWKTEKEATCVEGVIARVCSGCGEKQTKAKAANGKHSWSDWTVTKAATSKAAGERARTCSDCGKKETRKIDKTTEKIAVPTTPTLSNLFQIDNAAHATLVSSTAGGFTNSETAASLFDSAPYTKLCTNNTGYTIVWKLDEPMNVVAYSLQMGNDTGSFGRLPTSWTLEASKDNKTWKTVSNITNGGIQQANYAEKLFKFSAAGEYQYFRFTLKAPNTMTQMSEITLYTNEIPQTPALTERLYNSNQLDDSKNLTAGLEYVRRIIDDYYIRGTHTVGDYPGDTWTTLWPATSFLEAVAEAYRACPDDPYIYSTYIDLLNNHLGTYRVEATINTPNRGSFDVVYYNAVANGTGDYYYDDDAWVCLQFLNAYELLGDERYLELAEESLEFFWTGWDDVFGGGIYWDKRYYCKNTCADGPIAIAYLRAYELTGKQDYLDKGTMIYDWLREVMLDNNLYIDNIGFKNENDRIDYNTIETNPWKAAYNQGTPLAVGALLYRITGEERYLTETTAVWNATIDHMFDGSGSNTTMNGNPIYRAWCVGWLVRGFEMYYMVDDAKKTTAMDKMLSVLDDVRANVNYGGVTGYYDPTFGSGAGTDAGPTQILQTSGVATTFLLSGFFELALD